MSTYRVSQEQRPKISTEFFRILKKTPPLVSVSAILLILIAGIAIFSSQLSPHDPTALGLRTRLLPPAMFGGSAEYPLGTDNLGRDMLSRTFMGTRTSLMVASLGLLVGFVIGASLGILTGLVGGKIDTVVMFLVDTQMSIPFTLLALTAIAIFGSNLNVLIPVIGLSAWCQFARLARGEVRSIRNMDYFEAARALGVSEFRLAFRYVIPNILSPLVVLATYRFSQIILLESSLSFLGLGVQPPMASLGSLVGAGRDYLMSAWWITLVPATMLIIITMITSLLGDYVRDVFDPRLRGN